MKGTAPTAPLGNGVYGIQEAARLVGITPARARAWFQGWPKGLKPLFVGDYRLRKESLEAVSFLDLVDVLAVTKLRQLLPMKVVRQAYKALGDHFGGAHPFGRREFLADGNGTLLLHEIDNLGHSSLVEVVTKQAAFPTLLLPYLKRIEFDPSTGYARAINLTESVMVDARRRYGKPIVKSVCLPTAMLYQMYLATKSEDVTADWYGVGAEDVRAAIHFETEFNGLAA